MKKKENGTIMMTSALIQNKVFRIEMKCSQTTWKYTRTIQFEIGKFSQVK